jgi:hypothetical protein
MTGIILFFGWKEETEDVRFYTDMRQTNIAQDVVLRDLPFLLNGQRRNATSLRIMVLSKLSIDAMEYFSNWASHHTFYPHGEHYSQRGCMVHWIPDTELPTIVDRPGEQSLWLLTESQRSTLLESFWACACLDYTALGIAAASNRETLEVIRASLDYQVERCHGGNRCYTDAVPTPVIPDSHVSLPKLVQKHVETNSFGPLLKTNTAAPLMLPGLCVLCQKPITPWSAQYVAGMFNRIHAEIIAKCAGSSSASVATKVIWLDSMRTGNLTQMPPNWHSGPTALPRAYSDNNVTLDAQSFCDISRYAQR